MMPEEYDAAIIGLKKIFERERKPLSECRTHDRHSVYEHSKETEEIFKELVRRFDLHRKYLVLLGTFISLFHDIGKPKGKYHAKKAVEKLLEQKEHFCMLDLYTFYLGTYLIRCHHGSLRKPHELQLPSPLDRLNMQNLLEKIKEKHGVDHLEIADVFGVFKLADALSASGEKYDRFIRSLKLDPHIIQKIIVAKDGTSLDSERWKQQLNLSRLPSLAMLRAPTGWGKTTASLLFFSNANIKRLFILLPTTTAIRKFHDRLEKVFGKGNVGRYYHLYLAEVGEEEDSLKSYYFVKRFLSPIMITTIDQWLLTFLQVGSYHVKRPAFRCAGMVFDEIHVLSPIGLMLVSALLKKFADRYKMRCLFMSATFPKAYRDFLSETISPYFEDHLGEYSKLRRVLYELTNESPEALLDLVKEQMSKEKKVLVVVNTVPRAIQIAKKLEKELDSNDVILLHARYTYDDRLHWERQINGRLKNNRPHVLVSTQVCQVSLDVSYDFLITEIAPFGDIIQRFGRINRRSKKTYAKNACITLNTMREPFPYTKSELETSRSILEKFEDDKLTNEKELINELDQMFDKDQFYGIGRDILNGEDPESWFKDLEDFLKTQEFFSLGLQSPVEKIFRLLGSREEFTFLSLPSPEICADTNVQAEITKILEKISEKKEKFEERAECLSRLMKFLVPVPNTYLDYKKSVMGFPQIAKGKYTSRYGLELR